MKTTMEVIRNRTRVGSRNWVKELEKEHGLQAVLWSGNGEEYVSVRPKGKENILTTTLNPETGELCDYDLEGVRRRCMEFNSVWLSLAAVEYLMDKLPEEKIREVYMSDDEAEPVEMEATP